MGSQKIALVASVRADRSAGGHSGLNSHITIGSVIGRWLCGSYPAPAQQYSGRFPPTLSASFVAHTLHLAETLLPVSPARNTFSHVYSRDAHSSHAPAKGP